MIKCVFTCIRSKRSSLRFGLGPAAWNLTFQTSTRLFGTVSRNAVFRLFNLRASKGLDKAENPRLIPTHVTKILSQNEKFVVQQVGPVLKYESNNLPANNPMEDRRAEARLLTGSESEQGRMLFGVFDGHAGAACAQALSERLFGYIAVALAPPDVVQKLRDGEITEAHLLHYYEPDVFDYDGPDMSELYSKSLRHYAEEVLVRFEPEMSIGERLKHAVMRMDEDINKEAMEASPDLPVKELAKRLEIAFSGAVACVVLVDGLDLYVAHVGDCKVILGSQLEDMCHTLELTKDHSTENEEEVSRIIARHPNESANVLKGGRLLGDLAPLRAFGDARFKWPFDELKRIRTLYTHLNPTWQLYGDSVRKGSDRFIPQNYNTPPYLDAEPDIIHHRLNHRDQFMVLASDGLWYWLKPEKVVQLIAGHNDGLQVQTNYMPPTDRPVTLQEVSQVLNRRKVSLKKKPVDQNVTTHLMRNALGYEHGLVSAMLTAEYSRLYRDDITITVVHFDRGMAE